MRNSLKVSSTRLSSPTNSCILSSDNNVNYYSQQYTGVPSSNYYSGWPPYPLSYSSLPHLPSY